MKTEPKKQDIPVAGEPEKKIYPIVGFELITEEYLKKYPIIRALLNR